MEKFFQKLANFVAWKPYCVSHRRNSTKLCGFQGSGEMRRLHSERITAQDYTVGSRICQNKASFPSPRLPFNAMPSLAPM
jgi:hypothetical protein